MDEHLVKGGPTITVLLPRFPQLLAESVHVISELTRVKGQGCDGLNNNGLNGIITLDM